MKIFRYIVIVIALSLSACVGMKDVDMSSYVMPEQYYFEVEDNQSLIFTVRAAFNSEHLAECGFYYDKSMDMNDAVRVSAPSNDFTFVQDITLRDYDSDYYLCSFVSDGESDVLSKDMKKVSVGPISEYVDFPGDIFRDSYFSSQRTAVITVEYELAKGVELTSCGFCYGRSTDLSIDNSYVEAEKIRSDGFTATIKEVEAGVKYYFRPYIMDGDDIAYDEISVITFYAVPEVKTVKVSSVQEYSVRAYGEVMNDCGKEILERGFVWEEGDANPTIYSSKKIVSGRIGEFDAEISGLKPNTLYSLRAYSRNSEGTAYGDILNFTTEVALPSVMTDRVTSVTSSSAKIYANVSDDGGEAPSDFGVLLSTSSDIDTEKAKRVSASGYSSSFNVILQDLSRKTVYYVQAYATNTAGTSYGKVLEFETLAELPTITTAEVTDITDMSAKSGGNITDDGGDKITARGVVWGKSQNPTLEKDSQTMDGVGTGQFVSYVTELKFSEVYYVRAYATNSVGTAYGDAVKFETKELNLDNIKNLAEQESANCYIVSEAGIYRFPTVKGNSNESVGSVASVQVLWESFGTSVKPTLKDLIASVMYQDGQLLFETASTYKKGNAVIAAKDSYGTILWSWHIWLTDQPVEQVYANNAGVMMDRNLGATSAIPGDVCALGLLYQWGRKDPFLGSSSISSDISAKSTGNWPSADWSSSSTGTIRYAIRNPMQFILFNAANYDWYYTGSSSTDDTRWQSVKTIYDPCPSGWRVPDGGDSGVWANTGLEDTVYDETNQGVLLPSPYSTPAAWYPAAGQASVNAGTVFNVGGGGYYWSVTPFDNQAYSFIINTDGQTSQSEVWRAAGKSVRCLKIVSGIEAGNENLGESEYEW